MYGAREVSIALVSSLNVTKVGDYRRRRGALSLSKVKTRVFSRVNSSVVQNLKLETKPVLTARNFNQKLEISPKLESTLVDKVWSTFVVVQKEVAKEESES